jgi:hypothetical protein
MGGLMMLLSVTIATLLWSDVTTAYIWAALLVFLEKTILVNLQLSTRCFTLFSTRLLRIIEKI